MSTVVTERDAVLESALEIAKAAEEIQAVAARLTATMRAVSGSVIRSPKTGLMAERALVRAATDRRGLGFPPRVGGMVGQESLAVLIAVTSLRLRIAAVSRLHPEQMENEGLRRLIEAVSADKEIEAVRALRKLIKDEGLAEALTDIAPIFTELLAVNALLDENPLNDEAGWSIAAGRPITEEALVGISVSAVTRWDVGEGHVEEVTLEGDIPTENDSVADFMRNIAVVGNTGRILIQTVTATDGNTRYVLFAPGMQVGKPRNDSPQDLVGAWRNTLMNESPYTRAVVKAVKQYGVPEGAEIALIGHSEGGAVVMNLAEDASFNERYKVTHVVSVGAPVDFKKPANPSTWVTTITNQHDLIPSLDGQGPGSPFHLHPDWYVVDYTDPTHDFPACHSAWRYLANLEYDLAPQRMHIDANLGPYFGTVAGSQAYRLWDEIKHPEGFPFLTVTTSKRQTSLGVVDLPVRCYDGSAAVAFFTSSPDVVKGLLGGTGLRPIMLGGRWAMVGLMARELRRTSLGAFNDVALAILVHDPWRPRPVMVWAELMKRADRRRSGAYIVDLPVSSPDVEAARSELWGHPAFATGVQVTLNAGALAVDVQDPAGGPPLLEMAGRLGPWLPGPELDLVLYSRLGDETLRSLVDTRGTMRAHPAPGVRLRVGAAEHPFAAHLRALGLDGARPFLALSSRNYQARLGAGVALPVPS